MELLRKKYICNTPEIPSQLREDEYKHEENELWNLNEAIYGLKQAARVRNKELEIHLVDIGFYKFEADPSLRIMNLEKENMFVMIYVEGTLIFSPTPQDAKTVKDNLKKYLKTSNLHAAEHFLGIK